MECGKIDEMLEELKEEIEGLLAEIWEVMELIGERLGVKGLSEDVGDEVACVLVDLEETDIHFSDFNFSSNLE